MRRRKRDWPQRVYKFHAVCTQQPPQEMWTLATEMRDAWNWTAMIVAQCRADLKAHDCPRKLKRVKCQICSERWEQVWAEVKGAIAEFGFDSETATGIYDRAQIACRKGKLNDHHGLTKIKLWHRWGGGGVPLSALFSERAERFRLAEISAGAYYQEPGNKNPQALRRMRREGYGQFRVPGTDALIFFRADLHRQIPVGAIVKRVAWVGYKHSIKSWQWSVDVTVEELLSVRAEERNKSRLCGLDLGWRVMDGYIRFGFLVDSEGRAIELRLPLVMDNSATRRHNRREGVRYCPASMHDLFSLQSERDKKLDALKEAVGVSGNMRHRGLVQLRDELSARDDEQSKKSVAVIDVWITEDHRLSSLYLATYDRMIARRQWLYGNLAKWLAMNYDLIAWEKDLGVKDMAEAEDQNYVLKGAQKYRHFAAIGELRLAIKNAAPKYGATLIDCEAAGTTTTCVECGSQMEPTADLRIACSNGHVWDQDMGAAINLFSQTSGFSEQELDLRKFGFFKRWKEIDIPEELRAVVAPVHSG